MSDITSCRLCGSSDLGVVIDLGNQALGCHYPVLGEEAPRSPLKLLRCHACGLAQLSESVDPALLYRAGYGYQSGQTETMRKHLKGVVDYLVDEFVEGVYRPLRVLDIGCNDGTLLKAWPAETERVGFDPLVEQFVYDDKGSECILIPHRFSAEACKTFDPGPFDAITACAMLYDVEDPIAFLSDVAEVLAPDGLFLVEVMYVGAMLEGAWDHISHEHVTYWDVTRLRSAANTVGLRLVSVDFFPMNGGTIRCAFTHEGSKRPTFVQDALIEKERVDFGQSSRWDSFCSNTLASARYIHETVEHYSKTGGIVDVLGASQKGNTVLQAADLSSPLIRWASERDERRHGRFTPGSKIEIVSEEQSRSIPPTAYLVLPWHFRHEILVRERTLRERGVRFIFPLPKLEVVK